MQIKEQPTITIITPTYNRLSYLKKLFISLNNQTNYDFLWLIIDDGSIDGTLDYFKDLESKNFEKVIIFKENGGKHSALNSALDFLETELFFIVDSDDLLEEYAIQTILDDWVQYKNKNEIVGLSYLRASINGDFIGKKHSHNGKIETFLNERYNLNIHGDKAEVWRSSIFETLRFPIFEGEFFFPEAYLWIKASSLGKMVFFNKAIYLCEYLEGGLTNRIRELLLKNHQGSIFFYSFMLEQKLSLNNKVKYKLLLNSVNFYVTNKSTDIATYFRPDFLFAHLIKTYWEYKYGRKKD
jgi:glycosyltransferase involved in cell wall biosynthesis